MQNKILISVILSRETAINLGLDHYGSTEYAASEQFLAELSDNERNYLGNQLAERLELKAAASDAEVLRALRESLRLRAEAEAAKVEEHRARLQKDLDKIVAWADTKGEGEKPSGLYEHNVLYHYYTKFAPKSEIDTATATAATALTLIPADKLLDTSIGKSLWDNVNFIAHKEKIIRLQAERNRAIEAEKAAAKAKRIALDEGQQKQKDAVWAELFADDLKRLDAGMISGAEKQDAFEARLIKFFDGLPLCEPHEFRSCDDGTEDEDTCASASCIYDEKIQDLTMREFARYEAIRAEILDRLAGASIAGHPVQGANCLKLEWIWHECNACSRHGDKRKVLTIELCCAGIEETLFASLDNKSLRKS